MSNKKTSRKTSPQEADKLYTLEVYIVSGPMTDEFTRNNEVVCRTIEICGNQSLNDLHLAIFDAFDREEDHLYEFQLGGKRPMDPQCRCYVLPLLFNDKLSGKIIAGDVTLVTIGSLNLKVDHTFGYWFDFGEDWWHQINVVGVEDEIPPGEYPKVINSIGESPPQYLYEEDDEE